MAVGCHPPRSRRVDRMNHAYGSLATVSSTAASSRACRVCRAWGTISRSPSRPSHSTASAASRTRPYNTCTVASPGFWCSDIDAQQSTPSGSGAAHARGHRRQYVRSGQPERRLPPSSAHERARQATASPCPTWDHPVGQPSTIPGGPPEGSAGAVVPALVVPAVDLARGVALVFGAVGFQPVGFFSFGLVFGHLLGHAPAPLLMFTRGNCHGT